MAASRDEVRQHVDIVRSAFEELRQELEVNPVRDDICVGIEIGGASAYYITRGRLRSAEVASSSSSHPSDARTRELERRVRELQEELEQGRCDVRISFKDEKTLAEIVTRVRDALRQNDIPRVLSSLLCEMTLPTWGGGLRDIEVSGVPSLARLLWSAWLSRETDAERQHEYERSKQSWLEEDLSQGWVMVPHVSPGIKDRVAMFQSELRNLPVAKAPQQKTDDEQQKTGDEQRLTWMEELVVDLAKAAEQFRDTVVPPSKAIDAADDISADTTKVESCVAADAPVLLERAPPPPSSFNFL